MLDENEARWQRVTVEENPAFARFMGVHITSGRAIGSKRS